MALPTVQTIHEITEFSKTVSPFLHQLSPSHVLPLLRGEIAPKEWYLSTNPLMTAILFALTLSVLTFISAEINRNYSQVDRLWSMLPALYIAHFTTFAHMKELDTQRLDTLATFATLWGVCISFSKPSRNES
jgi:steroid 5-alpha reductase family enzyme